jgi:hypothetical protein
VATPFELRQLWFEPLLNSFLVVGTLSGKDVRFAVARAALNAFGWDACLNEAMKRVRAGERDFGIAPGVNGAGRGMVLWRIAGDAFRRSG